MTKFVIVSRASGKFLSEKYGIFTGDLEEARKFASRESANEMIKSSVDSKHRKDFVVKSL